MRNIWSRAAMVTATIATAVASLPGCTDGPPRAETGTPGQAVTVGRAGQAVTGAPIDGTPIEGTIPGAGPAVHNPRIVDPGVFALQPLTSTKTTCVGPATSKVELFKGSQVERTLTHSCFPYRCDSTGTYDGVITVPASHSCTTECATNADCAPYAGCQAGACVVKTSYCSATGLSSRFTTGERELCFPERCNTVSGLCKVGCSKTTDCAPGWGCDTDSSRCIRSCVPESGGCEESDKEILARGIAEMAN